MAFLWSSLGPYDKCANGVRKNTRQTTSSNGWDGLRRVRGKCGVLIDHGPQEHQPSATPRPDRRPVLFDEPFQSKASPLLVDASPNQPRLRIRPTNPKIVSCQCPDKPTDQRPRNHDQGDRKHQNRIRLPGRGSSAAVVPMEEDHLLRFGFGDRHEASLSRLDPKFNNPSTTSWETLRPSTLSRTRMLRGLATALALSVRPRANAHSDLMRQGDSSQKRARLRASIRWRRGRRSSGAVGRSAVEVKQGRFVRCRPRG